MCVPARLAIKTTLVPLPLVEEIVFPEIVMFVPAIKVSCFPISSLSTYFLEASLSCAFIAACNPEVLAKINLRHL
jgi:hypothetical protein